MPDGPDPVADTLARFTPAAPALDRDDLLFRAGRASARSPRGWKAAACLLAVTQAATLGLWLAMPAARPVVVTVPSQVPTPAALPVEPVPPSGPGPAVEPSSYLALSRSWDPDAPPPAPPGTTAPRLERPLTAGSRADLLN